MHLNCLKNTYISLYYTVYGHTAMMKAEANFYAATQLHTTMLSFYYSYKQLTTYVHVQGKKLFQTTHCMITYMCQCSSQCFKHFLFVLHKILCQLLLYIQCFQASVHTGRQWHKATFLKLI